MSKRLEVAHFGGVAPAEDPNPSAAAPTETETTSPANAEEDAAQPTAVQGFVLTLSPEMQKRVRVAEAELFQITHRITVEIPKEIESAASRLAPARATIDSTADRLEAKRTVRQAILVAGGDVVAVSQEIADIQTERDLAEDLATGLVAKIAALDKEGLRLQAEDKPKAQRKLFELGLDELVTEYNATAQHMAQVTEAVYRHAMKCGVGFGPGSVGTVWPSSWPAF